MPRLLKDSVVSNDLIAKMEADFKWSNGIVPLLEWVHKEKLGFDPKTNTTNKVLRKKVHKLKSKFFL